MLKIQELSLFQYKNILPLAILLKISSIPLRTRCADYSKNVLKIKSKVIVLILIAGIGFSGKAQEMHGFVHSNNAGITGSFINPSSLITSKLYLDINVLGLHVNADNNYVYLSSKDYKLGNFLSKNPELPTHNHEYNIAADESAITKREYYDRYNTDLKNVFSQVRIMGPSAMIVTGKQAFGLSTSYRILASGNDLPYDLAKFALDGLKYYDQQNINYINNIDFRLASLALAEIAGSYSRILYRHNREYVAGGITLKGLFSSGGAFGFIDNIDYIVPNANDMVVNNANGRIGTSLPIGYDNNDFNTNQLFLGKGIGFDIGFTYQKMMQGHSNKAYSAFCEVPYQPYLYRIGISLLDVGSVKFKDNPISMKINNAKGIWENDKIREIENINDIFETISNQFSENLLQVIDYSDFAISLPTALSVQVDYNINNKFYVNSTWIQPVVMSEATVIRPSQIAITPRMETDRFGLAIPLVLYNYQYPRIGLSARFRNFIIGTDKLGSFFGLSDFTGMDFYVMVKLQFYRGHCPNSSKNFRCQNLEY